MSLQLFIEPDAAALAELAEAWSWLVPSDFEPLRFTRLGDVFYLAPDGGVHWLDTGIGEITAVAVDIADLDARLASVEADEWLLPPVVAALEAAGKHAPAGWCYSPVILTIFAEGSYAVDNWNPVPAREHYGVSGGQHRQIRDLPDGAKVSLTAY